MRRFGSSALADDAARQSKIARAAQPAGAAKALRHPLVTTRWSAAIPARAASLPQRSF
jgi:hypothetical protein